VCPEEEYAAPLPRPPAPSYNLSVVNILMVLPLLWFGRLASVHRARPRGGERASETPAEERTPTFIVSDSLLLPSNVHAKLSYVSIVINYVQAFISGLLEPNLAYACCTW